MRFRFWPNTLRVQLIVVVAAAVAVSNLGVAYYFYRNSEAQTRNFVNERMIDRAAAVAATVSQVQPQSRLVVMRTMGRADWRFREATNYDTKPMTAEEAALAKRLSDALPDQHPRRNAVIVHLHEPLAAIPEALRPVKTQGNDATSDVIQTIVPIDAHSMMSGVLVPPTPDWPYEIMVAAAIAVVAASAGAAFIARRVVRAL
ncbi:MAG TPA: hypothetical protein VN685_00930, partial [Rhizomicrobium sp.]|nr:hypothetical protein [Rhizomicrobium sp.]